MDSDVGNVGSTIPLDLINISPNLNSIIVTDLRPE